MKTIALNWELGADYGHINRFLLIASALRANGHHPVCVLRDISRAEEILGGQGIEYLQAPVWQSTTQGLPPDLNLTETLYRFGFLNPEGLTAMVRAWRALWTLLKVDLLLFDHSPTACLAARGFGIPRILIGNSFAVPPIASPLPPYRWWQPQAGEQTRLLETEQRTVRNINACALRIDMPRVNAVSDLFKTEETLICGWPTLDVYGQREHAEYIGPINNSSAGATPIWPPNGKKRAFVYLKPHYKHFDAILTAMAQSDAQFLIIAPGIAEATAAKQSKPNIMFSATPMNMNQVVKTCDLIVCHAGGMTDIALSAGLPVLQLPMQMEQTMTSRRTEILGAGLYLPTEGNPGEFRKLLKKLLNDESFTLAARRYASTLAEQDNNSSLERLVQRCNTYLN